MRITKSLALLCTFSAVAFGEPAPSVTKAAAPAVSVMRVPHGGLQPDVVVDSAGVAHMVYLAGEARSCDAFYVRSADGGSTFSEPIRVNSRAGSAVAVSTIRGPHLAIGRNGRAHVIWNGHSDKPPAPSGHRAPAAIYSRMNDSHGAFENERVLELEHGDIDGGTSIAANADGRVWITWHAPMEHGGGEQDRRVWVRSSIDEGATFAAEKSVPAATDGVCGCCNMRAFAGNQDDVFILYRSADRVVHRDMHLVRLSETTGAWTDVMLQEWNVGQCVMSTAAFARADKVVLGAWETRQQIYWTRLDQSNGGAGSLVAAPGSGKNRKHPAIAANSHGQVILAWTEGTSWGQGGSVAWQVFSLDGTPIADSDGRADDLPVWDKPAVFNRPGGGFVVVY